MAKAARARIKDTFPILSSFGEEHEFLDTDAAILATRDERIKSIIPFLIKRINRFQESLKPRERANFDHEDTFSELYVKLAEKDADWSPERGKYITYVGVIIDRELSSIRDKSRTVESPRNSFGRLKEYQEEEESDSLSARRRKTAEDIRRTAECAAPLTLAVEMTRHDDPSERTLKKEIDDATRSVLIRAIRTLTLFEAQVLGRSFGLFGRPVQTLFMIAWETGVEQDDVRLAKQRALAKVREILAESCPPALRDAC